MPVFHSSKKYIWHRDLQTCAAGSMGSQRLCASSFPWIQYDKNTLFLFCGRRSDRIKALLWEGDGFLLLYKRLDNGAFRWPRSAKEALELTEEQYRMLMQGLEITARHPIAEVRQPPDLL